MRRRQVDETRLAWQSLYYQSLFINRDRGSARAECRKQEPGRQVTWILSRNAITGRYKNTSDEIKGLLSAIGDCDIVRRRLDSPRNSDLPSNGLAQASVAGGVSVHARVDGFGTHFLGNQTTPRVMRKK